MWDIQQKIIFIKVFKLYKGIMVLRIDIYAEMDEQDVGQELPIDIGEIRGSDGKIYTGTLVIKNLKCIGEEESINE